MALFLQDRSVSAPRLAAGAEDLLESAGVGPAARWLLGTAPQARLFARTLPEGLGGKRRPMTFTAAAAFVKENLEASQMLTAHGWASDHDGDTPSRCADRSRHVSRGQLRGPGPPALLGEPGSSGERMGGRIPGEPLLWRSWVLPGKCGSFSEKKNLKLDLL